GGAVVVLQVVVAPRGPLVITVAGVDPDPTGFPVFRYTGDGGLATHASMALPSDIAIAPDGFYVADYRNQVIRFVDRTTRHIKTYAGAGGLPLESGKVAISVDLGFASSVAVDRQGRLYFLTDENQDLQVWTVDSGGLVQRVTQLAPAGNEPVGVFREPGAWVASASDGTIYIGDRAANQIWTYVPSSHPRLFAGYGRYGYRS